MIKVKKSYVAKMAVFRGICFAVGGGEPLVAGGAKEKSEASATFHDGYAYQ